MAARDLIGDGIAVTLHELVHEIDRFADDIVRNEFGISYSQYHFLAVASTLDEPDVTTLAECLLVSKAAVSKRLDGFERDGWITLGSDPANARRVIVNLTPRAATLVTEATAALEAEFASALDSLPAGDVDALTARLRVLLDIFVRKRDAST